MLLSVNALTATPSAEDVSLKAEVDGALRHCLGTLPANAQAVVFYADVCQWLLKDVAAIERFRWAQRCPADTGPTVDCAQNSSPGVTTVAKIRTAR